MSYADPQSLTIDGTAVSLPRVGSSNSSGTFRSADQTVSLEISHTDNKRIRRLVRLRSSAVVASPLVPNQNVAVSNQVYLVLDQPKNGISPETLVAHVKALAAWLSAGTNAQKFVTGEQ